MNNSFIGTNLKVRVVPRDLSEFPRQDEALGRSIFSLLHKQAFMGPPAPQLLLFRSEQIDCFSIHAILKAPPNQRALLLASIAGQRDLECSALLASFQSKRPKNQVGAFCFLEWPNNRWWLGWQQREEGGGLLSGHLSRTMSFLGTMPYNLIPTKAQIAKTF